MTTLSSTTPRALSISTKVYTPPSPIACRTAIPSRSGSRRASTIAAEAANKLVLRLVNLSPETDGILRWAGEKDGEPVRGRVRRPDRRKIRA